MGFRVFISARLQTRLAGQHRPIDDADHDSGDRPFDEVGDGLLEGKGESDIQVDVIVDHKRADEEDSD